MIGKLNHIAIAVPDLTAAAALYRDTLGAKVSDPFDLPEHGGEFDARVPAIRKTVAAIDQPWVVAIRQFKVDDPDALDTALARVLARGGEGLILHRGDAPYRAGRSDDVLKLKPYEDAEARVIGINP